jgi:hypothetical protein
MYIYFQNPTALKTVYMKAQTDVPILFSGFKYNPGFWPPALVAELGNLVLYRSKLICVYQIRILFLTQVSPDHEFGGHFSGVDNPPTLIEDLREIGKYWPYGSNTSMIISG